MNIAIIGGGAAGFFAAINIKENYPNYNITIFEKSGKLLSKVKISGGGRCNITNGAMTIKELASAYPRGEKQLKKAFREFDNKDAYKWFETRGVQLVTQEDNCVFPKSQNSQTVIDCFLKESKQLGIKIKKNTFINSISSIKDKVQISFEKESKPQLFDKVIVATGGSPQKKGLEWLKILGHKIENPVPSLFTFNMPKERTNNLMGIVVEETLVSIQGTKLKSSGPLLFTHWGMSGPAILELSSYGARILSEKNYKFTLQVNWVNITNHEEVLNGLKYIEKEHKNKILANYRPFNLPERLWFYLIEKSRLSNQKRWGELGKKGLNKLVNILTHDEYSVEGKTTFKEEFVTCGGVSLEDIDIKTMQSKIIKNLYFAGEVLNIDGITGGYNFQAAWTTGFIAAKLQ